MDKELERKVEDAINRYLAKVAEENIYALPDALCRVAMLRAMLMLLGSFISDFDNCLKQLEKEFKTLKGGIINECWRRKD